MILYLILFSQSFFNLSCIYLASLPTISMQENNSVSNDNQNQLGAYLAGLIEGDGSIYTPSSIRNSKGQKISPHIEIAFDIKDLPLIEKIKQTLNGGYIVIRKNKLSGSYVIKKQEVLLKLISLINGKMRTPKIEALHRLIKFLNNNNNFSIPILGIDTTNLNYNAWLSGLIESDANFYFNWKLNKKKYTNKYCLLFTIISKTKLY